MGTAIGHWIDFRAKSGVSSLQLLHMGIGKLEPLTIGSLLNVGNIVSVISLGTLIFRKNIIILEKILLFFPIIFFLSLRFAYGLRILADFLIPHEIDV